MTQRSSQVWDFLGAVLTTLATVCAQGEGGAAKEEKGTKQAPAVEQVAKGGDSDQGKDAAPAYRRMLALLRERFGANYERLPERDYEAPRDPAPDAAVGAEWRTATANGEAVLAQWEIAVAQPRCRFRASGRELLMTEFVEDMLLGLQAARRLVIARALQAIADGDAGPAVGAVSGLLANVQHLRQEPSMLAWLVAASIENQVGELHESLRGALGAAAAERSRAAITQHLESRAKLAALGAAARIDVFRLFDGSIAQMKLGKDAKAEAVRTLGAEIRRAFTAMIDPLLAVAESAADGWTADHRASFVALRDALLARRQERMQVMRALMRDETPPADFDAAPDLALLLAALLFPNFDEAATEHDKARERLRDAIR